MVWEEFALADASAMVVLAMLPDSSFAPTPVRSVAVAAAGGRWRRRGRQQEEEEEEQQEVRDRGGGGGGGGGRLREGSCVCFE
jgi:hypothetical protein